MAVRGILFFWMLSCREGETIGPYQVGQVLGRGSFGVVLLAEDPYTLQRLALKVVPCDHLDVDAAARARSAALSEAELLRRLRHPHVVTCHDVRWDSIRRVVWFALDFMDGGDLQSLIEHRRRSGELPPEAAFIRRVVSAIGSALRYIHSQGVLHRDVKSSNVLLSRDVSGSGVTEIKLADFGISKLLEFTVQAHTVVGTPPYMSPELVRGEPYGMASDAWAFGVLLYELAALRRPFEAGNQLALVRQIVDLAPAPLPPSVAPDLARAITGLLEKDQYLRLQLAELLTLGPASRGITPFPPAPSFPPPVSPFHGTPRGWDNHVGLCDSEEADVTLMHVYIGGVAQSPRGSNKSSPRGRGGVPQEGGATRSSSGGPPHCGGGALGGGIGGLGCGGGLCSGLIGAAGGHDAGGGGLQLGGHSNRGGLYADVSHAGVYEPGRGHSQLGGMTYGSDGGYGPVVSGCGHGCGAGGLVGGFRGESPIDILTLEEELDDCGAEAGANSIGVAAAEEHAPDSVLAHHVRTQAKGLHVRAGFAFSGPEEDHKNPKDKQKTGGRSRWLQRFGMGLLGASKQDTVISAFEIQPGGCDDDGSSPAAGSTCEGVNLAGGTPQASPRTKWTGSILSSPNRP